MKKKRILVAVLSLAILLVGCGQEIKTSTQQEKEVSATKEETIQQEKEVSAAKEETTLSQESVEFSDSTEIKEKIKFYLGLDMDESWEMKEYHQNPDDLSDVGNSYIFVRDGKSGIAFYQEDKEGNLFSVYTDVKIGTLADNSEEKQKSAALQYITDKKLAEAGAEINFLDAEQEKGFINYIFEDNHNQYMIGVSDRNTEIVSVCIFR